MDHLFLLVANREHQGAFCTAESILPKESPCSYIFA